ncbi:MAG TPA: nucleotidyltransferase family protein [Rhizobacter sp.]|nr:nucleotidyltransferase family protein [Rhizobacter sp.]
MASRPAVIVLAAGQGPRFSGLHSKLTQHLGTSDVLGTTLRHALASQWRVVVVTTEPLRGLVNGYVATRDVVVIPEVGSENSHALGMGYSIAAGVAACSEASGWLVLPADMPMVEAGTLQAVGRELEHHSIVYAQHRGRRGHPVGFAAELYTELVMLTGDDGARRLLARYPSHAVEVDDPGVLLDVDTEADLYKVRAVHESKPVMPPLA